MNCVAPTRAALLGLLFALAACSDSGTRAATAPASNDTSTFLWGVAASGFQSEGGTFDSNWQRHVDAGDADPYFKSVDFRNRYPQDLELARGLGVNAFRFGINWARIEQQEGVYDQAELAYYDDLVATILAAGMTPIPTLHHFVLPGWVVDQDGWTSAKTVEDFARYGAMLAERWKTKTRWWLVLNEPVCDLVIALTRFEFYPTDAVTVADHMVQAHGRAYDAIHAAIPGAMVSSNECSTNFADPIAIGLDLTLLDRMYRAGKLDFIGLDVYYRPNSIRGIEFLVTKNGRPWEVAQEPYGMYEQLTSYHRRYPGIPLMVTENGMPTDNAQPRPDGLSRADHLRDNVYWMQQAMKEGVPVLGYLYWSLTDNYEWGTYQPRFGLYTVDVTTDPTLERKPTDAVAAYRCVIRHGGVPDDYQPVRSQVDGSANGVVNREACP